MIILPKFFLSQVCFLDKAESNETNKEYFVYLLNIFSNIKR